ncbi:hypothetical protein ACO1O0_007811 [Amphichorda felina]
MIDPDFKFHYAEPRSGSGAPAPPFHPDHQLNGELDDPRAPTLPGYPNLPLKDKHRLWDFLRKEFWAEDLHRIADRLWWMSKQDSSSISPIHRQTVKRRTIIITEDPKLHLVWIHDRIFIKPLPKYILSHYFWLDYFCPDTAGIDSQQQDNIRRAALGYLRTYIHLIRYESDFRMAQDASLRLIPCDVSWEQFCALTSDLSRITDHDVSARYHFGEIRLTRLNFYAPITLGRWAYHRVEYQSATYFSRFYGPILFLVGMFSVILSGLQVSLEVDQSYALTTAALGFSVFAILGSLVLPLTLGMIFLYKTAMEWKFAIHDRVHVLEKRRATMEAKGDQLV